MTEIVLLLHYFNDSGLKWVKPIGWVTLKLAGIIGTQRTTHGDHDDPPTCRQNV